MLLQLLVQSGKVGMGSFAGSFNGALVSEQCLFNARLVPAFRQRPANPCHRCFLQVAMHRSLTDRTSSGDLPLPQPQLEAEAEYFLDLAHGQSPGWHAVSPSVSCGEQPALCDVQRYFALVENIPGSS